MTTEVRTAACPRGCGGTLTIHDRPILAEGQDAPLGWEYVGVRCSMGCRLREGEVPRRVS
jgi:hypothetical protein